MFRRRANNPEPPSEPSNDWSLIENVRREWPPTDFGIDADLQAWREGRELYNSRDDYAAMMRAAELMSQALRHHLYGAGILAGADLPETTHAVLFASFSAPPDGQSFPQAVQARARLALTVIKKHGWQATEHGGSGQMGAYLGHKHILVTTAIAPRSSAPWSGDVKSFYTRNPIPADTPASTTSSSERAAEKPSATDVLDDVQGILDAAHRGDSASAAHARGIAHAMNGDAQAALAEYQRAAQMGDVTAMFDAGSVADELGQMPQRDHWWELAANSGHPGAMINLGISSKLDGDLEGAARWWQAAGEAGEPTGYAHLTQMADESGDAEAEFRWSRLGADAGQSFCLMRHGQIVMRSTRDQEAFQRALPLLEFAAEKGESGAMFLLGVGYGSFGDRSVAMPVYGSSVLKEPETPAPRECYANTASNDQPIRQRRPKWL